MSTSTAIPSPVDQRPNLLRSARAYWRLAGAYWTGNTAGQAWTLTLVSLVLVIGNIIVQYGINRWNRAFFNALERHDHSFVYRAIAIFLALV